MVLSIGAKEMDMSCVSGCTLMNYMFALVH